MSRSRFLIRPLGIVLVASAAIIGGAAPASASGQTRWVDDDGKAGPTSCSGTATAKTHIQDAVAASGANDTVEVCNGTYIEQVIVDGARDGLTLRSVASHGAIIRADAVSTFNTITLLKVSDVDDVTIEGFSIQPLRDHDSGSCDWANGIRAIGAKDLTITGVEVTPSGSGPFCGVADGIRASGGTTGLITASSVTDYREEGIQLSGSGTDVTVDADDVTFAQIGLDTAGGAAIQADTSAKGHITDNTITGPGSGSDDPPQPAAGVALDHAHSGSVVRGNTIKRMAADIYVYKATDGYIKDNVVSGGQTALDLLDGDRFSIHGNTTSGATVHGIAVGSGSKGNNVHDNDFRSTKNHKLKDCKGQTGTGTNNTWSNNQGDSSSPAVLCAKPIH